MCVVPGEEIRRIRSKFKEHATGEMLTEADFYQIPVIAMNPLKERLFQCFDTTASGLVSFNQFISLMAVFSFHGPRDSKLRRRLDG